MMILMLSDVILSQPQCQIIPMIVECEEQTFIKSVVGNTVLLLNYICER